MFDGYFFDETERQRVRRDVDPAAEHAGDWQLEGRGRWLWRAARERPWAPAQHPRFPPAFQAAARALLLAAHRGGGLPERGGQDSRGGDVRQQQLESTRQQQQQHQQERRQLQVDVGVDAQCDGGGRAPDPLLPLQLLGRLEPELLQRVIALAAYPLSAWQPEM